MSIKTMFGQEAIYQFLDTLYLTIQTQRDQLKEQISTMHKYSEIQEKLNWWRQNSTKDIQMIYDRLEPLQLKDNKPEYDVFIQIATEEMADDAVFREKMKRIGEEITDLKELVMVKIQDDISIYNTKNQG